jgi:hypothetical protein
LELFAGGFFGNFPKMKNSASARNEPAYTLRKKYSFGKASFQASRK